jgi:hypothetical protein
MLRHHVKRFRTGGAGANASVSRSVVDDFGQRTPHGVVIFDYGDGRHGCELFKIVIIPDCPSMSRAICNSTSAVPIRRTPSGMDAGDNCGFANDNELSAVGKRHKIKMTRLYGLLVVAYRLPIH